MTDKVMFKRLKEHYKAEVLQEYRTINYMGRERAIRRITDPNYTDEQDERDRIRIKKRRERLEVYQNKADDTLYYLSW